MRKSGVKTIQDLLERTTTTTSGCMEWGGHKSKFHGYGKVKINGKALDTHRASMILTGINIPPNHDVCHKCDNPPCVNPNHLFIGTRKENVRDCINKGRFPFRTKKPLLHGTVSSYLTNACRCAFCKKAKSLYAKKYKASFK